MARQKNIIPTAVLSDRLTYDPETGVLRWRVTRNSNARAGHPAGRVSSQGYIVVALTFEGRKLFKRAHHLAWQLHYGAPAEQIDHVNHDRADNRIANLRLATVTDNVRNASRPRNNTSGVTGVYFDAADGRWRARIGKPQKALGSSPDFFEAVCLRKSAEVRLGYHPNHGR